jgi:hypothetical protein
VLIESDGMRSARADLSWPSDARTVSSLSRTGARRLVVVSLASPPAPAPEMTLVAMIVVIRAGSSMGVVS